MVLGSRVLVSLALCGIEVYSFLPVVGAAVLEVRIYFLQPQLLLPLIIIHI